ncbi:Protein SAN1 [Candida viswanathii]|uniref:Protein SAN1 n=1 Tax=Candida viswanathii TaxID=5486 RepID=A0A367Y9Y8_9ASCO|nr:Protein SAN1 [Candida viswanathii]
MPEDTSHPRNSSGDNTSHLSNSGSTGNNRPASNNRNFAPQNPNGPTDENNPNRRHRRDLGIFDRFMDTFLRGARLRNSSSRNNRSPSPVRNDITEELLRSATEDSRSGQEEEEEEQEHPHVQPQATVPGAGDEDSERAIIITVNYVFSDESRPTAPNRSGSLIMSLPNNASNREPGVIQEFIRLATQMAYSSIINGLHQEKGTTLEKFRSFNEVPRKDLGDNETCSICFEKFELLEKEKREQELGTDDEIVHHKKRRLFDESSVTTSSSSNSRNDERVHEGAEPSRNPVFLMDYSSDFNHVPIKMPCSHVFGQDCLCEWLKSHTTCPLCRFSVAEEDSNVLSNNEARNVSIFTIPADSNSSSFRNVSVRNSIVQTPFAADAIDGDGSTERVHYFGFNPASTSPRLVTPVPSSEFDPFSLQPNQPQQQLLQQPPIRRIFRSTRSRREREARLSQESRNLNPFAEVVDYIRGRGSALRQPEPLFPIGMTSRRTANGIETRLTDQLDENANEDVVGDDSNNERDDDLNMRSLYDASPMPEARSHREGDGEGNNGGSHMGN